MDKPGGGQTYTLEKPLEIKVAKTIPDPIVDVVIPAFNEEKSIGKVLDDIPSEIVRRVIVVDNGSRDNTSLVAKEKGAEVIREDRKGYGQACLTGIEHLRLTGPPDILVFLDGDYSDHPEEMFNLIEPLKDGKEMVIGSRSKGKRESGSMTPQQVFGNKLATFLLKILYRGKFSDLGPFRAILWETYERLGMKDTNFGWTVEMQVKALKKGISYTEVPVTYRRRIGISKVSGTIKGTLMAGYKIILTILRYL